MIVVNVAEGLRWVGATACLYSVNLLFLVSKIIIGLLGFVILCVRIYVGRCPKVFLPV